MTFKKVIKNFGWKHENFGLRKGHSGIWLEKSQDPVTKLFLVPPKAKPPPMVVRCIDFLFYIMMRLPTVVEHYKLFPSSIVGYIF